MDRACIRTALLVLSILLLIAWLRSVPPSSRLLGPANSSSCLPWMETCKEWEVCAGNVSTVVPTGWSCAAGSTLRHVLVVHEQHPQELGCDRRLLAIVQLLRAQGLTVSLLYRKHVPPSMQSPRTPELAALLGVEAFDAEELDGCLRPLPPVCQSGHLARPVQGSGPPSPECVGQTVGGIGRLVATTARVHGVRGLSLAGGRPRCTGTQGLASWNRSRRADGSTWCW